jgi:hypothetical protein
MANAREGPKSSDPQPLGIPLQADNGPVPNEVNPRKPRGQLDGPEIATATGRPNVNVRTGGQVNAPWVDERPPVFWLRSPPRDVRESRVGA